MAFTEIPADMDVAKYMVDKHARLFQEKGLNASHFDLIAGHLVAALQQLNVAENLIAEVVAIVGPLRPVFADEAERILNEN
jgi:truncated hemoglobin YjbI